MDLRLTPYVVTLQENDTSTLILTSKKGKLPENLYGITGIKGHRSEEGQWYLNNDLYTLRELLYRVPGISLAKGILEFLFCSDCSVQLTKESAERMLDLYTKELKSRLYTRDTISLYRRYLNKFFTYILTRGKEISCETLAGYLGYNKYERDLKRHYRLKIATVLRIFINTVLRKPALNNFLLPRYLRLYEPSVLSVEEVLHLLSHCRGLNSRLIFSMAYASGLKLETILKLQVNNLSFDERKIYVPIPNRYRLQCGMIPNLFYTDLKKYLHRNSIESGFIFKHANAGTDLSAPSLNSLFTRIVLEAGYSRDITTDTLRYSFSRHLLECGIQPAYISRILGHNNLIRTLKYLRYRNPGCLHKRWPHEMCLDSDFWINKAFLLTSAPASRADLMPSQNPDYNKTISPDYRLFLENINYDNGI